jgi:class 3 adenylate cyclase
MVASGQDRIERRLAAILAADVAGYSRLTGVDEEGTHVQLQAHLRALVDPKVAEHRGRVVKNTGDGMLAEFSSVVDAVRCALDVQRGMAERNAEVPDEKRIEFRMGINVGDIIIDRGDIFGDGVNVATRLEGLAKPGGICISDDAHRQVRGKFDVTFEDAGERQLKNIARPVRVYRVRLNKSANVQEPALSSSQSIGALTVGTTITRRENIGLVDRLTPAAQDLTIQQPETVRWRVGRTAPLETLDGMTQRMLAGERQVVFITGEAGIGKTTFIEMAVERLSRYGVDVLRGHCMERFGTDEAFHPLIDALMTRCRGPGGSSTLEAIRTHAPTWMLQMPSFREETNHVDFQKEVFGATRERMLREFCDLVEVLSANRPLVVILEDLHRTGQ